LATATLLSVAIVACGSPQGANGGTGGGTKAGFSSDVVAQKVEVSADPRGNLKWDQAEYAATAGDVTFVVANPSVIEHNFGVKGGPDRLNVVSKNFKGRSENTFTLKDLKAGEYQIVCTVPGHNTMVAKLLVR
jgi:plastocyanin